MGGRDDASTMAEIANLGGGNRRGDKFQFHVVVAADRAFSYLESLAHSKYGAYT